MNIEFSGYTKTYFVDLEDGSSYTVVEMYDKNIDFRTWEVYSQDGNEISEKLKNKIIEEIIKKEEQWLNQ